MKYNTNGALVVALQATAADIDIVDAGGHYAATEVESALQGLGHLTALTVAEVDQLENIGATTISTAQWGALGALVEWTAWVPTLTGDANLSGYTHARYYRIGDLCCFSFSASNKNVTTAGAAIEITLPFNVANTGNQPPFGQVNDGTAWIGLPHMMIVLNSNYLTVYKTAAAGGWAGTETGVVIYVLGFFEIA